MLRFLVKVSGEWVRPEYAMLVSNGTVSYKYNGKLGVAGIDQWFLAPETLSDPAFKTALWSGLDLPTRQAAIERRPDLALLTVIEPVKRKDSECESVSISLPRTRSAMSRAM